MDGIGESLGVEIGSMIIEKSFQIDGIGESREMGSVNESGGDRDPFSTRR
jgi:hypothetical protein